MKSFMTERSVVSLFLVLVAGAFIFSSLGNNYADLGGAFDPMFFPKIILGFWLLLAIINLITDVMAKTQLSAPMIVWRVLALATLMLIYVLSLTTLGFFITSCIFSSLVLPLLDVRKTSVIVLFSLSVPASLVVLFNHILILPLPTSPFTYFF